MLIMGKYPLSLKRRITGSFGHLSNEDAGTLAAKLSKSGTKKLLLGHLSEENNYPELALLTVKNALADNDDDLNPSLYVVPPRCSGEIFSV